MNKPAIVGMRPVVNAAPTAAPESEGAPDASNAAAARELREVLGLGDTALEGALLLAAAERIRTLEEAEQQRQAAECVSRAMAAGKLTPAQRDWAMGLALRDRAAFEEWEAAAPAMVPLGRLKPPSGGASADVRPRAVGEAARAEWRAHREFLEQVCSEEAYVAQAVRENAAADGVRQ